MRELTRLLNRSARVWALAPPAFAAALLLLPSRPLIAFQEVEISVSVETEQEGLRRVLQERYDIEVSDGDLELEPREEWLGVRTIRITDGQVLVNGQVVSAEVLQAWLGDDAEPILELAELEAAERLVLLGFDSEAAEIQAEEEETTGRERRSRRDRPGVYVGSSDERVVIGSSVVVEEDETVSDVVVVGGSMEIRGEVLGDAVVIGGSAKIAGRVTGDAVAVMGSVELGPDAEVLGDVAAIGGSVDRPDTARVTGEVIEISVFGPRIWKGDWEFDRADRADRWTRQLVGGFLGRVVALVWSILFYAFLGLMVCLVVLLGSGPVERVAAYVGGNFWKAGLAGLLAEILFLPLLIIIVVLLCISIVGIPLLLLIPFAVLALIVAAFVGFAAVAYRLGQWGQERFGWQLASPYMVALLGLAMIVVWSLLGDVIGLGGKIVWGFTALVGLLGGLVQYVAWTVGFGAMLLTRFGTGPRQPSAARPPEPPAPPAPGGPPEPPPPPSFDLGEERSSEPPPQAEDKPAGKAADKRSEDEPAGKKQEKKPKKEAEGESSE